MPSNESYESYLLKLSLTDAGSKKAAEIMSAAPSPSSMSTSGQLVSNARGSANANTSDSNGDSAQDKAHVPGSASNAGIGGQAQAGSSSLNAIDLSSDMRFSGDMTTSTDSMTTSDPSIAALFEKDAIDETSAGAFQASQNPRARKTPATGSRRMTDPDIAALFEEDAIDETSAGASPVSPAPRAPKAPATGSYRMTGQGGSDSIDEGAYKPGNTTAFYPARVPYATSDGPSTGALNGGVECHSHNVNTSAHRPLFQRAPNNASNSTVSPLKLQLQGYNRTRNVPVAGIPSSSTPLADGIAESSPTQRTPLPCIPTTPGVPERQRTPYFIARGDHTVASPVPGAKTTKADYKLGGKAGNGSTLTGIGAPPPSQAPRPSVADNTDSATDANASGPQSQQRKTAPTTTRHARVEDEDEDSDSSAIDPDVAIDSIESDVPDNNSANKESDDASPSNDATDHTQSPSPQIPAEIAGRSKEDSQTAELMALGVRCEFQDGCQTHSPFRKVISNWMGRNKKCVRDIPKNIWVYYCRKHYQRCRFRDEHGFTAQQCEMILEMFNRIEGWSDENQAKEVGAIVSSWIVVARKREAKRHAKVQATPKKVVAKAKTGAKAGTKNGAKPSSKTTPKKSAKGKEVAQDDDESDDDNASDEEEGSDAGDEDEDDKMASKDNKVIPAPQWIHDLKGQKFTFDQVRDIFRRLQREVLANRTTKLPDVEFLPNLMWLGGAEPAKVTYKKRATKTTLAKKIVAAKNAGRGKGKGKAAAAKDESDAIVPESSADAARKRKRAAEQDDGDDDCVEVDEPAAKRPSNGPRVVTQAPVRALWVPEYLRPGYQPPSTQFPPPGNGTPRRDFNPRR